MIKNKLYLFLGLSCFLFFNLQSQKSNIQLFPLSDVRLLSSPFLDAQNTDLNYMMSLDPDRLLAPYLREAGLTPKAENYPNWENTGLDGHIGGHYLTALSLMYAATGDAKVLERLDYMLAELNRCQQQSGDGYIGGVPGSKELWADVAKGKIEAGSFDVNKKWVPLYNIHKPFGGLRDAYIYAHRELAKEMLVKYADWMLNITANLSDEQVQKMLRSEHGGLNEVFADVADITGDKKYLTLAYRFSHLAVLDPLAKEEDKLNFMHANTQIPKVIGFERIAELSGDTAYATAARFFWETVVNHRTCAIGGNSVREHFHPADNFSSMITSEQGPETCNTYNMLKLTKMLFTREAQVKYADYYERALYNHILSTQHPDKGGFVYFTPLRPGHYRVYSQSQLCMWCCVGSGLENHAKYGEFIYAHTDKALYVNLFVPSRLTWNEKGVVVSQQTSFPDEEKSSLVIEEVKQSDFNLNLRYPRWVAPNAMVVEVNGKPVKYDATPESYIVVKRRWKKGDRITVSLPMQTTTEQMPDGSDYVAVLRGPIVLAAKTDTTNLTGLFADESRMGHVAQGPQYSLLGMPIFVSSDKDLASHIKPVANKTMTFTANDLIFPDKYKNLELIPFFKIHDSRYVIYWQTTNSQGLQDIQLKLAEQESEAKKLAEQTIDVVFCGEQQPESDHFIDAEKSNTGVQDGRLWREAHGWFGYRMNDKDRQADKLRVVFVGNDRNRHFSILVNDQVISEVDIDDKKGNESKFVDYQLPESVLNQSGGKLFVKFVAKDKSMVARISEVRLLRK